MIRQLAMACVVASCADPSTDASDLDPDTTTDSETDSDTSTDTYPCWYRNKDIVGWLPPTWLAREISDERGVRDNGMITYPVEGHPGWGIKERFGLSINLKTGRTLVGYATGPVWVTDEATIETRPEDRITKYEGILVQESLTRYTFDGPRGYSMVCDRKSIPADPHFPIVDSHMLCTDSEGRSARMISVWNLDGYGESCFYDHEPVAIPLRWVMQYRTRDGVESTFPHHIQLDGAPVSDLEEIWLQEDMTGGYVHMITAKSWDFHRWLKHEEMSVRVEGAETDNWRIVREDGHIWSCQRTTMRGWEATPTKPFALACTDSEGVISEWHPLDVGALYGFSLDANPGGWWVE